MSTYTSILAESLPKHPLFTSSAFKEKEFFYPRCLFLNHLGMMVCSEIIPVFP